MCKSHSEQTALDESRLQLAAFIAHRPPLAIAKYLTEHYIAEHKATHGARYVQQSNNSIKAATGHSVHV